MAAITEAIPVDSSGIAVGAVPWSAVEEALRSGLLDHLAVDGVELAAKLKGLSLVEEIALIEMVERRG